MEDNKVLNAQQAVQTMLCYYLTSLIPNVDDPKQYIATKLGEMINFSEDQIRYVQMNVHRDGKLKENLSSSIQLLESIEKTGVLDLESIKIVRQVLQILLEDCNTALDTFGVIEDGQYDDDIEDNIKV